MPLVPVAPVVGDAPSIFNATPPLTDGQSVGLRHFHATDSSRDDVSTGTRQFMVSAFYPAQPDAAAPPARLTDILAPKRKAALELLCQTSVTTHEKSAFLARCLSLTLRAQRDLKPAWMGACPILIYYPGGVSHRLSNAALCEQLACAGYIVFALDAPRDAPLVVFPEGQLVSFLPDNNEDYIWPRVADVRFLLDCLEDLNETGPFAGRLDLSRIGMFGHSRGGYLSNICAVEDARIGAAVNMDGFLWGLWTEGTGLTHYPSDFQQRARTLKTPILRLCSDQGSQEAAQSRFNEEVNDFGGDFVFGALDGYNHGSFATTPWMNGDPENLPQSTAQAPPPPKQIELLTELLTDFFDTFLRNHRPRMNVLTNARRR